ncbi:MAG: DUF2087 domain-containing protein [Alphaproteobacteria bacterium]|jgi:hypothetical protein|nr:hypothetical protein [Rhodospirillaceae bacterium]MDP6404926.1 DUF2087 domain-containing protein [Alphaproteobacteria bacterium]MDP6622431.1 DUF2087 domain-containing protein [Alphaproteobacteria bacterium]
MIQAIAYIRVFASERSLAGPGLQAQREILENFAAAGGFHVVREYIEVERGTGADRMQGRSALIRALKRAHWLDLPVLVAGLDAVARDTVTLAEIMTRGVRLVVAGGEPFELLPYTGSLSAPADTAAPVRRRGNPQIAAARRQAAVVLAGQAQEHAKAVEPYIREAREAGLGSFRRIADHLAARGVPTARGGTWSAKQVSNIIARLEPMLHRFLESDGRLRALPRNRQARGEVLRYLAAKFDAEASYAEGDVNALIRNWHSFGDHSLLRRELVEAGLLKRTRDGSKYWIEG